MLASDIHSVGEGGAVHWRRRTKVLQERRECHPDVCRRKPNDTSAEREREREREMKVIPMILDKLRYESHLSTHMDHHALCIPIPGPWLLVEALMC